MTSKSTHRELRELLSVWIVCVSLPVPAVLYWHSVHGRSIALGCFLIGCAMLVAFSFGREIPRYRGAAIPAAGSRGDLPLAATRAGTPRESAGDDTCATTDWRGKIIALLTALLAAVAVFSVLCLAFNNPPANEEQAIWWRSSPFQPPRDLIAPMLALMTLVPTLGVVPYLTLVTRSRFAAVIFTLFLVFCMKLLGGIVVVLVYGWDAAENGHTTMPWHHPDLLVWLFWGFTLALSLSFYFLGARRFRLENHKPPAIRLTRVPV